MLEEPKFQKGQRVRVVKYPAEDWVGNTGVITRVPGDPTGRGSPHTCTMYAMTFDGREGQFAPFEEDELEAIEVTANA